MDKDELYRLGIDELLVTGPVGNRRYWAGHLVLRMLDSLSTPRYRYYDRYNDWAYAETALDSIRAAAAVMTFPEQGLFVLAAIFTPWLALGRASGLTLKMRDVLEAIAEIAGKPVCLVAARSVFDMGRAAVHRYQPEGLFPENRKPGEGISITFSSEQVLSLGLRSHTFELDRLVTALERPEQYGWESNLRQLTTWWLENSEQLQVDREVNRLISEMSQLPLAELNLWRALGLMDWLADNPGHPRAQDAVKAAARIKHAPLRKSAAKLAALTKSWDAIERLAQHDPDRGVRELSEKLLAGKNEPETPPSNDQTSD
ncbi:MAG: hypothetical protein ACP5MD_00920 [Verrucomicrobiia bacterium]